MTYYIHAEETGCGSLTLADFKKILEEHEANGKGHYKVQIAADEWYYWIIPSFKEVEFKGDILIHVAVTDSDDYRDIPFSMVEEQASVKEILEYVNCYINEKNKNLILYAEWVGSYNEAAAIPYHRSFSEECWNFDMGEEVDKEVYSISFPND